MAAITMMLWCVAIFSSIRKRVTRRVYRTMSAPVPNRLAQTPPAKRIAASISLSRRPVFGSLSRCPRCLLAI